MDWLPIIRKSDLSDEIKREFFQALAMSVLLYSCTAWTLRKRFEKKLNGNCTMIYHAALYKQLQYGHLLAISQTILVRRTRHAGHF